MTYFHEAQSTLFATIFTAEKPLLIQNSPLQQDSESSAKHPTLILFILN